MLWVELICDAFRSHSSANQERVDSVSVLLDHKFSFSLWLIATQTFTFTLPKPPLALILKYKVKLLDDGDQEIDFNLALTMVLEQG